MSADDYRPRLIADIERAWDWLERWGHAPTRQQLGSCTVTELLDTRTEVTTAVRGLAENWELWW